MDCIKRFYDAVNAYRWRRALLKKKSEFENLMNQDFDKDLSYKLDAVNYLLSDLGA